MKKLEYKIVEIAGEMPLGQDVLDVMGSSGWQLICSHECYRSEAPVVQFIFMRSAAKQ